MRTSITSGTTTRPIRIDVRPDTPLRTTLEASLDACRTECAGRPPRDRVVHVRIAAGQPDIRILENSADDMREVARLFETLGPDVLRIATLEGSPSPIGWIAFLQDVVLAHGQSIHDPSSLLPRLFHALPAGIVASTSASTRWMIDRDLVDASFDGTSEDAVADYLSDNENRRAGQLGLFEAIRIANVRRLEMPGAILTP